ncbi:nicotianamine synthase family protein [Paenibacillus sp. y28]|uniref:nicotianamine synthase family protein n=1 Tax=Paenibacillus sp. y28 TaxID=3129110 RepID=UPI003016C41A
MKSLDYEINQLTAFSKTYSDCFDLLQMKLDKLCQFMTCKENEMQWSLWGSHDEIKRFSEQLRETSNQALCSMEKYQSIRALEQKTNMSQYIANLAHSVKEELQHYGICSTSKVLFVGSGAFPLSALTIARETNADVLCLDIDSEAITLGKKVAEATGLQERVQFSQNRLTELSFMKEATHVMIASLVENKHEVLEELKHSIKADTRVMVRYGNGLKSIFNYPLEQDLSHEWEITTIIQSNNIYDTLVLQRKKN